MAASVAAIAEALVTAIGAVSGSGRGRGGGSSSKCCCYCRTIGGVEGAEVVAVGADATAEALVTAIGAVEEVYVCM